MVRIGSYAYCIDTTGVHLVKIFQVFGASYKRHANLGDVVYVVVRGVDTTAHYLKDDRTKFKFRKGSVHRAIVVHVREKVRRYNRTFM
jgi:ribosomal protein L14